MGSQISQGSAVGCASTVREKDGGIYTPMVDHSHGLQVIVQGVSKQDGFSAQERVQCLANRGQRECRLGEILLCNTRETCIVVTVKKVSNLEEREQEVTYITCTPSSMRMNSSKTFCPNPSTMEIRATRMPPVV